MSRKITRNFYLNFNNTDTVQKSVFVPFDVKEIKVKSFTYFDNYPAARATGEGLYQINTNILEGNLTLFNFTFDITNGVVSNTVPTIIENILTESYSGNLLPDLSHYVDNKQYHGDYKFRLLNASGDTFTNAATLDMEVVFTLEFISAD